MVVLGPYGDPRGVGVSCKRGNPVGLSRCHHPVGRGTGGANVKRGERPKVRERPKVSLAFREIGVLLPNNQRQHRTLHIQKDVLPYALC